MHLLQGSGPSYDGTVHGKFAGNTDVGIELATERLVYQYIVDEPYAIVGADTVCEDG